MAASLPPPPRPPVESRLAGLLLSPPGLPAQPAEAGAGIQNSSLPVHRVPKYKVQLVRDGSVPFTTRVCSTPRQAADLFRAFVGDSDREHLVAMFLDTQNRFLGLHTVSIGTLDHSVVHPREVFKAAILSNASSLVLAHNHPSGESAPSEEDVRITRELQKAGELLDIPLMDHIVVGEASYASFMEMGLLDHDLPEPKQRRRRKTKEPKSTVRDSRSPAFTSLRALGYCSHLAVEQAHDSVSHRIPRRPQV